MRTLILITALAAIASAQPQRPRITGVSRYVIYAHDMDKSRVFYHDFLGFGESSAGVFKVNERQSIEVIPEKKPNSDRLDHFVLETSDVEAMRAYLQANGVPMHGSEVTDPDGHVIEFAHHGPDASGLSDARISKRMAHVGILVGSLGPAMKFYGTVLGFKEIWRGSKDGKTLNWVNMRVPDGLDYLEFMLYDRYPAARLGTLHHVCLEVPDIDKAKAELETRAARIGYTRPLQITTGTNRKRQMNLYDPDGTRSEVMEPNTIDGKPTPPATAPPPR